MAIGSNSAGSMKRTRQVRRLGAWVALMALLLQVLMPAMQAWAAPPADLTFPPACVAHGDPAGSANGGDPAPARPFTDCALCLVHCAAVPVLATDASVVPQPSRHGEGLAVPMLAGRVVPAHPDVTYPRGPPSAGV